jgi:transcriptional regulator with XRE-family HTH domain
MIKLRIQSFLSMIGDMQKQLQKQGKRFAELVGLELRGTIAANGYTQAEIADHLGHSHTAFGRWLKGNPPITVGVLYDICADIQVNPRSIIGKAYNRLLEEEFVEKDDTTVDVGAKEFLKAMRSKDAVAPDSVAKDSDNGEHGVFYPFASRAQMHQFVKEVLIPQLKEDNLLGLAAEQNPDKEREKEGGEDR